MYLPISSHLKKSLWVNEAFLQENCENGLIGALSFYCIIRSKYHNPIIYNFSYNNLARKIGVKKDYAYRHIKQLIELGWAYTEGNHLRLIGNRSLKKQFADKNGRSRFILFKRTTNKTDITIEIKKALIKSNLKRQEHKSFNRLKSELGAKKLTRKQRKTIEEKVKMDITLSNRKIGEMFGQSQKTGQRIQKLLNDVGFIHSKSNNTIIERDVTQEIFRFYGGNPRVFYHCGIIYLRKANIITLGEPRE